jgi:glutamine cyclotransferase
MARKSDKKHVAKATTAWTRSRVLLVAVGAVLITVVVLVALSSMRSSSGVAPSGAASPATPAASDGRARQVSYEVVNSYPHDSTSFTQGLLWRDGGFYESTGMYGESKLRRLEFPSGKVLKEVSLGDDLFGEGLALVDTRLIQLTWTTHRGFTYDIQSFKKLEEFRYDTEGWGLTYDGTNLILSDGSSDLFYLDPHSFKVTKKLPVTMNGQPITELNELEFIEGEIWSNVWQTDLILRIDPATGRVTSFLKMNDLLAPADRTGREDVLNGIAYDADKKRIFVTGKRWPRIFEIKIK